MLGSIFERETLTLPRRSKHFIGRVVFIASLFIIICTAWLLLAGIQPVTNLGDLARFGCVVFQIIAPLQLVVLICVATLAGTTAVSQEKDRRTFLLLLMTSLTNWELVIGKMGAGLLAALNLFFGGTVVMMTLTLFGGVSVLQVLQVAWITLGSIFLCCAFGTMMALWREKTFQAIAVSLLGIVLWIAFTEVIVRGLIPGVDPSWAYILSPMRGVAIASQPIPIGLSVLGIEVPWISGGLLILFAIGICCISVWKLRVWNPSREARPMPAESEEALGGADSEGVADRIPAKWKARDPRPVWDNPILWREMRTWAYGRKVLIIRLAYLLLALVIGLGLYQSIQDGRLAQRSTINTELVPDAARLLSPLLVVSLIIVNALAVNSITNERDGQALDLLLVTEITPPRFLFGKLVGVLYVAKEMVLVPIALCIWLWFERAINTENLVFTVVALLVMNVFVTMLGVHCGMIYSQSRIAIATSMGTVFFLFLGVVTCMLIMISFRGSFGRQLAPFLAIILGGGTGLYVALGNKNPSAAITLTAFGLPFLTFFAITSFILRDQELTVFSVLVTAYGFATLAMMIPAISEFEFSFGRSQAANNEG